MKKEKNILLRKVDLFEMIRNWEDIEEIIVIKMRSDNRERERILATE